MEKEKIRYSDKELEEFRVLIQSKIDKAEEDLLTAIKITSFFFDNISAS